MCAHICVCPMVPYGDRFIHTCECPSVPYGALSIHTCVCPTVPYGHLSIHTCVCPTVPYGDLSIHLCVPYSALRWPLYANALQCPTVPYGTIGHTHMCAHMCENYIARIQRFTFSICAYVFLCMFPIFFIFFETYFVFLFLRCGNQIYETISVVDKERHNSRVTSRDWARHLVSTLAVLCPGNLKKTDWPGGPSPRGGSPQNEFIRAL